MHQDIEGIGDTSRRVVYHRGIHACEVAPRIRSEDLLGGRLGENLHGDGVALIVQPIPETRLIMREIVLPRSTEKSGAIDFGDIHHRHLVPVPHDGELTQAREKGLDMVGNADTERIVNGVCHAVLDRQPVTLHKALETRDTRLAAPRPEAKGIEMVDAVGYAEPLDERREPDTAGDHEDQRAAFDVQHHAPQPTQEFRDSRVTVGAVHPVEENRQFVDDKKNRLVMLGAIADQRSP